MPAVKAGTLCCLTIMMQAALLGAAVAFTSSAVGGLVPMAAAQGDVICWLLEASLMCCLLKQVLCAVCQMIGHLPFSCCRLLLGQCCHLQYCVQ